MEINYNELLSDCNTYIKNKLASLQDDLHYPQIVFPNSFCSIFNYEYREESVLRFCRAKRGDEKSLRPIKKPIKPSEPRLRSIPITHREMVDESFWESGNWRVLKIWLILAIVFAVLGFIVARFWGGLIFVLISIPILFHLINEYGGKRNKVFRDVPYSVEEVDNMKRKEMERFNKALDNYPNEIKKYEVKLEQFDQLMQDRQTILLCDHRAFYSSVLMSHFIQSGKFSKAVFPPQKGRSENMLFTSLKQLNPSHVHIDTTISGYFPDIVVSTQNNVFIDVEVDEPYEIGTKKEIHFIGGEDDFRNTVLSLKEWFIIRFSERQVMTNCSSCSQIIEKIVAIIERGDIYALEDLITIRNKIKEKKWTKEEAKMMAKDDYRNTY